MPATIGMWRYEYTSLASAARSAPGRLGQPGLRDEDDPVEVRPPQARGDRDPQQSGRDLAGVERKPGRADADRHDRLPERDDDDQAEALDEVLRRDAPSPHVANEHTEVVDRERRGPERQLRRPVEEAGDDQQDGAEERRPATILRTARNRSRSPRPAIA